jgi:hypothetical protein
MKITCQVDQSECFRRGIDAPASTVQIEVDPAQLDPEMRAFIADHLQNGSFYSASALSSPTYEGFVESVTSVMPSSKTKIERYFMSLGLRRLRGSHEATA